MPYLTSRTSHTTYKNKRKCSCFDILLVLGFLPPLPPKRPPPAKFSNHPPIRNQFVMFLPAFVMFLLFSLSAAASTPVVKRSTHTSSHHTIVFVLIFVAMLVILALLAFIVYRFIIKRRQSNVSTPTPTFVPRSFLLRTDTSSNQSTDLEKGAEDQKAPIGPISSPILLFGTGAMVFNPDCIGVPKGMKEMDITDTPRSTDRIILRYMNALSDDQDASEPLGGPDWIRETGYLKRLDKDRLSMMTIVACSIETELNAQDDTRDASDPVKNPDEIQVTASPIVVCPVEIDNTLVESPHSSEEKGAEAPVSQSLSLSKRDIFVIDDDEVRKAPMVTDICVQAFGIVEGRLDRETDEQRVEAQSPTSGSSKIQHILQCSLDYPDCPDEGRTSIGANRSNEQHSLDTTLVADQVEADTTLIDTADCIEEKDARHQPIRQHSDLARRDIFVINDEKGPDGAGLTEKDIEELGNAEELCDNEITIRAEARAMIVEKFKVFDNLGEEGYLAQLSTTTASRESETGLSGSLSSSLASLNIQDLVDPIIKDEDTREVYSLAQAEEELNAVGHLTSAFSMSDISDDDTPRTHPGEDADSPTYPRKGYLQPSRSMFESKEEAQAFLWRCRVDMQRSPDIRVLILNPASRDSGSHDRATVPAYHTPVLSMTQESMRKELRYSAKRSSVIAYRPTLSSPLASDSERYGLLRSKSFSRWPLRRERSSSSAAATVSDNNTASGLLVGVLRRSHLDGMLTKAHSTQQQLADDDDIFWSEAEIRPESPLFFEVDPTPLFFEPEVVDPFSSDPKAQSIYTDDADVEPMEIASASWFVDSTPADSEILDNATPSAARAGSGTVFCENTRNDNHDLSRLGTPTSSPLEPGLRLPSMACARMPTVAEEVEEGSTSSLPSLTPEVKSQGDRRLAKESQPKLHTLSSRRSVKISPPSRKEHSKLHCSRARSTSVSTNVTSSSPVDRLPYGFPSPPTSLKTQVHRGPPAAGLTRQKSTVCTGKRERSVGKTPPAKSSVDLAGSLESARTKRRGLSDISNSAYKNSASFTATGRSRSSISSSSLASVGCTRKSSSSARTRTIENSPPPSPPPQTPLPPIPQRRQRSSSLSSSSITTRESTPAVKKPFRI